MVIITTPSTLYLVDLTCPFTRNIDAANNRYTRIELVKIFEYLCLARKYKK